MDEGFPPERQRYAPDFIDWEEVKCKNCQFYQARDEFVGSCRRRPEGLDEQARRVYDDDWCGEFYPRGEKFVRSL